MYFKRSIKGEGESRDFRKNSVVPYCTALILNSVLWGRETGKKKGKEKKGYQTERYRPVTRGMIGRGMIYKKAFTAALSFRSFAT